MEQLSGGRGPRAISHPLGIDQPGVIYWVQLKGSKRLPLRSAVELYYLDWPLKAGIRGGVTTHRYQSFAT